MEERKSKGGQACRRFAARRRYRDDVCRMLPPFVAVRGVTRALTAYQAYREGGAREPKGGPTGGNAGAA